MRRLKQQAVFLIALPLLGSLAYSQSGSGQQSYSLGAHEHGKAELTIAIEGSYVEMQFISPAANIFGFEHVPSNREQKQQIQRAEEILSAADRLFEFEGVICQPIDQTLDIPFSEEISEAEQAHEHHAEHSHEQEHRHQHGDHQNEHVEVLASYRFDCEMRAPTGLRALILDQFPAIESLDVQWVTDTTQGAQELTIDQTKIDLR